MRLSSLPMWLTLLQATIWEQKVTDIVRYCVSKGDEGEDGKHVLPHRVKCSCNLSGEMCFSL